MVRARCPFDPVVGEPLLLGFFELRGDLFDAEVVGVDGPCELAGWLIGHGGLRACYTGNTPA